MSEQTEINTEDLLNDARQKYMDIIVGVETKEQLHDHLMAIENFMETVLSEIYMQDEEDVLLAMELFNAKSKFCLYVALDLCNGKTPFQCASGGAEVLDHFIHTSGEHFSKYPEYSEESLDKRGDLH